MKNNTVFMCGTLILLACIGAVVYLSNTNTPDLAAIGIISTIIVSVLAGTFGLVKLGAIEEKVDRTVQQTNGGLDARIHDASRKAVEQALRNVGLPPVPAGTSPITKQEEF